MNEEVTTENAMSPIGMHAGRRAVVRPGLGEERQVRTAWIWLRAETCLGGCQE